MTEDALEIRRVGDRGLLLELADNPAVHAAARAAHERFGDELEEVVPGHVTLLLVWRDGLPSGARARSDVTSLIERPSALTSDKTATEGTTFQAVTIDVIYDGPDLERVAQTLRLSVEALTELHAEMVFRVAFMGFVPGFPYLIADTWSDGRLSDGGLSDGGLSDGGLSDGGLSDGGLSDGGLSDGGSKAAELLSLPRLATPRTEVPAGSVAVAAGYCGIYPRSSPGGWNLLGRTDAVLFDPVRARPALLTPGTEVRFVAA